MFNFYLVKSDHLSQHKLIPGHINLNIGHNTEEIRENFYTYVLFLFFSAALSQVSAHGW